MGSAFKELFLIESVMGWRWENIPWMRSPYIQVSYVFSLVCSHTFTLFWLRNTSVTIKIFWLSLHVPFLQRSLQFLVKVFPFLSHILCYNNIISYPSWVNICSIMLWVKRCDVDTSIIVSAFLFFILFLKVKKKTEIQAMIKFFVKKWKKIKFMLIFKTTRGLFFLIFNSFQVDQWI